MLSINHYPLIEGNAAGTLLTSDTGLSFWGGVNPSNGVVIDQHHPLHTQNVKGKILALPSGRGSSSGSGVILELLLNNAAPAALIFAETEDILTLGVLVAEVMFDRSIPVCRVNEDDFKLLESGIEVHIADNTISASPIHTKEKSTHNKNIPLTLALTESDQKMLNGDEGEAAQLAMQIVVRMAALQGASKLVDVVQAHIDACVYNGPSSLLFAQRLASLNGQVKIPTTLNALSVDKRRWREQGVNAKFGEPASQLGDAFLAIGAKPSYTCAPYLLDTAPQYGQQIVWAESNAVMFANSVIGARTQKYPDFLDACIALTAREPATGAHLDDGRSPTVKVLISNVDKQKIDDSFWPLLGYHVGSICQNDIPLIYGLEYFEPSLDNHKAFSAAFATTSAVPMYHIHGITPEAKKAASCVSTNTKTMAVDIPDLHASWKELNSASVDNVDLICLGNPHFSATECIALAELCDERTKHASVSVIVTLGREVYKLLSENGTIQKLESFGVEFINDTCWCMIEEPIIPVDAKVLMTNSGKYAHYGPGIAQRPVHFGSLAQCVDTACTGKRLTTLPDW